MEHYDTENAVRAFLNGPADELSRANGRWHFVIGPARSGTSIAASILSTSKNGYVFFEDMPCLNIARKDFRSWYNQLVFDQLNGNTANFRMLDDNLRSNAVAGSRVYMDLLSDHDFIVSKYALGPHGDYYWRLINTFFFQFHDRMPDARFLACLRSPYDNILAMHRCGFFRNRTLQDFLDCYIKSHHLIRQLCDRGLQVWFTDNSELSVRQNVANIQAFMDDQSIEYWRYEARKHMPAPKELDEAIKALPRLDEAQDLYHRNISTARQTVALSDQEAG